MPSTATRAGRALPAEDRAALENWDTRALPYGFVCAEGGLLARHGVTAARPNIAAGASELRGTPIADQDPDGGDSMFITIPPPFIELPVKMSDIAMYFHEYFVLSRKNGKVVCRPETNGGLAQNYGHKLRKGHVVVPIFLQAESSRAPSVHLGFPFLLPRLPRWIQQILLTVRVLNRRILPRVRTVFLQSIGHRPPTLPT
jgi:hypothetical protein